MIHFAEVTSEGWNRFETMAMFCQGASGVMWRKASPMGIYSTPMSDSEALVLRTFC